MAICIPFEKPAGFWFSNKLKVVDYKNDDTLINFVCTKDVNKITSVKRTDYVNVDETKNELKKCLCFKIEFLTHANSEEVKKEILVILKREDDQELTQKDFEIINFEKEEFIKASKYFENTFRPL